MPVAAVGVGRIKRWLQCKLGAIWTCLAGGRREVSGMLECSVRRSGALRATRRRQGVGATAEETPATHRPGPRVLATEELSTRQPRYEPPSRAE